LSEGTLIKRIIHENWIIKNNEASICMPASKWILSLL
jgi:hypothetical protein